MRQKRLVAFSPAFFLSWQLQGEQSVSGNAAGGCSVASVESVCTAILRRATLKSRERDVRGSAVSDAFAFYSVVAEPPTPPHPVSVRRSVGRSEVCETYHKAGRARMNWSERTHNDLHGNVKRNGLTGENRTTQAVPRKRSCTRRARVGAERASMLNSAPMG